VSHREQAEIDQRVDQPDAGEACRFHQEGAVAQEIAGAIDKARGGAVGTHGAPLSTSGGGRRGRLPQNLKPVSDALWRRSSVSAILMKDVGPASE
jgi:hypothetical protein